MWKIVMIMMAVWAQPIIITLVVMGAVLIQHLPMIPDV